MRSFRTKKIVTSFIEGVAALTSRATRKLRAKGKDLPHYYPHSLKRRSRYVPAGDRQNCGHMGISPKRFRAANSRGTEKGRATLMAAERRLYDMRNR